MDLRTETLLGALDPIGAELLQLLLVGPLTESEILDSLDPLDQSTCNRRLHRLRAVGLVQREPGRTHAPGRRWAIRHPSEVEALLTALLELAEVTESEDRSSREKTRKQLARGRAQRLGIHSVGKSRPKH